VRLAALAALGVVVAVAVLPAHAANRPIKVTRVQVSAKEFWYGLSRRTVAPGPAIVQLVNFGEDDHDLRLRRIGGTRTYTWPELQPGAYFDRELTLRPGRYRLWCSVGDHEERGMKAVLTVAGLRTSSRLSIAPATR
jgi:plastocyanin